MYKSIWLFSRYPIFELIAIIITISLTSHVLFYNVDWCVFMFKLAIPVVLLWKRVITLFGSRFAWVHAVLGVTILVVEYSFFIDEPSSIGDKLLVPLGFGIIYAAAGEMLRALVRRWNSRRQCARADVPGGV
ncbi:hypothetical protein [Corynebacterium uterequi]|uniref:Uncharacterized protein n=1 Tax=Corynebacterium uterequi TaxID=1072256 RepID=A0A0G3HHE8_9CORY|nr:hypothetical protein [Corynebacterium uterequi]AKK10602.1 hypothetical protein CUTER_02945 [Corynebacterium uterequi]